MKHALSYYLAIVGGVLGVACPLIGWVRSASIINFVNSLSAAVPEMSGWAQVMEFAQTQHLNTPAYAVTAIVLAIIGVLSIVFENRNNTVQGIMAAVGFVGVFFMGWWSLPAALCFFVAGFLAFFRHPSSVKAFS